YSMCVSKIAQSKLSENEKEKYIEFVCYLVKKFDFEAQQEIFSYCLVRIAYERLPCCYVKPILESSEDLEDLKKQTEDLIIDIPIGEEVFEVLYYLQDCLKTATHK
ncbi:MAG: hypothetical protein ACE5HW_05785, partial [Candidatus Methanofastidiosia archaeon]